ncbi:hypothetical protein H6P81_008464 [Aristolochia fimbriata]|uniref:BZIP domain-containing protein n=1 Tax=Aristolochia fimbriata TaxID=158543 RepID=A0AAV7EIC3_ARIFI|nr:hypothetical protein H6P81_008464 [Aristolochia fimbriata]
MFPPFQEDNQESPAGRGFPSFRTPPPGSYNFLNYQSVQSLQVQSQMAVIPTPSAAAAAKNIPTSGISIEQQWGAHMSSINHLMNGSELLNIQGGCATGDNSGGGPTTDTNSAAAAAAAAAAGEFFMSENVSVATAQYQFQAAGGVGNHLFEAAAASRMVNISTTVAPPPPPPPHYPIILPPGDRGSGGGSSSAAVQRQKFGEVVSTHSAKKYKRMIKNRESAARSRARKQAYTNQLEIEVKELRLENEKLKKGREVTILFLVSFSK